MLKFRCVAMFIAILLITPWVYAQNPRVECGDIVEGEFTEGDQVLQFKIKLNAGGTISVYAEGLGDYFRFLGGGYIKGSMIVAPSGDDVAADYRDAKAISMTSGELSENGDYTIQLGNRDVPASFTMEISCTLRDGTQILPGSTSLPQDKPQNSVEQPLNLPAFGFPGLPPVDFANAFRLPLTLGTVSSGEIPTVGDAVLGFKFAADRGDKLDLSFVRTSGNLNLGLVVLSSDNEVAYMAALVSSETMSTTFTLPSNGEYTIGIFRIDLIPPTSPQATGFEILAEEG